MNEHKLAIEQISELFKPENIKKLTLDTSIEMIQTQYQLLVELFDSSELEEDKQYSVRYAIQHLLPLIKRMLVSPKVDEHKISLVYSAYRKTFAFCGRRSFQHFIEYMEWERPTNNKVFERRKEVLTPIVFYLNKMMFDEKLKYFVFSLAPSMGKSFLMNYFSAWVFGVDINSSILRMSYNDDLLNGFSRSIKDLISSDLFSDIFPVYKIYRNKPYDKEKEDGWRIKNADVAVSHYVRTRDGGTTGVRANKAIIFDDMTKGRDEAHNDALHTQYWEKYTTEWFNRRDNDNVKYIFGGTMWTPKDILNRITEKEGAKSPVKPSERFKYVWECEDGHAVFIRVPLLDENDKSTCESVMSTKEALSLREETDPFLWSCVYQQNPIAPTGMEFAWENLKVYDELPRFESNYAKAFLDPTRRGKDNISMPICRVVYEEGEDIHYVVDWYYKRKAMTEAYDEIIEKIIEHNILNFEIENNTDTSLKVVIEDRLNKKGFTNCIITEKFQTIKKEVRIKDARGLILRKMRFKKKGMFSANSDYARAMEAFTTYSFDYANKNDDAPDSLAGYVNTFMIGARSNKVEFIDRSLLGF